MIFHFIVGMPYKKVKNTSLQMMKILIFKYFVNIFLELLKTYTTFAPHFEILKLINNDCNRNNRWSTV